MIVCFFNNRLGLDPLMSLVPESSSFSMLFILLEVGCTREPTRPAIVRSLLLSSPTCSFIIIISIHPFWCASNTWVALILLHRHLPVSTARRLPVFSRSRACGPLHEVQHRVHTAMVPALQLELSTSRCQVPGFSSSRVLRVDKVGVSVGFLHGHFNAARGTYFLRAVRIASRKVALFHSSRDGVCFLSASSLRRSRRDISASSWCDCFCPVNPLDCNHSRIIGKHVFLH